MAGKHWDVKRTHKEKWTSQDYHIDKFINSLESLGGIGVDPANGHDIAVLVIYNRLRPSESIIIKEVIL